MPRPARFNQTEILAATGHVVAERGPAGTSIARIAKRLGAPTGSIYHRFASRAVLLGEVWLGAASDFQNRFAQRLENADAADAGLDAVRFVPAWVRGNPQEARILLLHRREDFLDHGWPAPMMAQAKKLHEQLSSGLEGFCHRLTGRSDATSLRVVAYALAEAPLAAVRRHVESGEPPPDIVDDLLEETYRASLALLGVSI